MVYSLRAHFSVFLCLLHVIVHVSLYHRITASLALVRIIYSFNHSMVARVTQSCSAFLLFMTSFMSSLNCSDPCPFSFRSSMSLLSLPEIYFCLMIFRKIVFPSAKRSCIHRSLVLKSPINPYRLERGGILFYLLPCRLPNFSVEKCVLLT